MMEFTNCRVEGDYVLGHVKDVYRGLEVDIKVHKSSNEFYISNGETCGDFVKAAGVLQCRYIDGKMKESFKVNWGM